MFIHVYDASKPEKFLLCSPLAPPPLSPCTHPLFKNLWILYIETNVLIVNAPKMNVNIGDLIRAEVFFWSTVAKVNLRLFFNNHF